MTKHYAVTCQTCEAIITLMKIPADEVRSAWGLVPPLKPIPCPECGSHHQYGSDDVAQIDVPGENNQGDLE